MKGTFPSLGSTQVIVTDPPLSFSTTVFGAGAVSTGAGSVVATGVVSAGRAAVVAAGGVAAVPPWRMGTKNCAPTMTAVVTIPAASEATSAIPPAWARRGLGYPPSDVAFPSGVVL